ncbi:hypothetical protein [Hydrogenophaga sp.]|uniref:hypothetical protein n=1 Tax=Hydrogenophaga sp. TaxID=1904254 RepID=UPI002FC5B36E
MSNFVLRVIVVLLAGTCLANADSWLPPSVETFTSADGRARVVITPRPIGGALSYFEDKVAGKEPAGQRPGNPQTHPTATLEQRASGRWTKTWTVPLVNDVGPTHALLADGGRYLVTFDNWHAVGHGEDVVVIYGGDGKLIRKFALKDFLAQNHIALLPGSVSSLWWGGEHALSRDGETLVLRVIQPSEEPDHAGKAMTAPVRIRLSDGHVLPKEGKDWERTQAVIDALDARRKVRWQQARALRASPLRLPTDPQDEDAWTAYAVELRERLSDATGHRHAGSAVSREELKEGPGEHFSTFEYLLDGFADKQMRAGDHFLFVAPDSQSLADALSRHLSNMKQGALEGATITIVGTPGQAAAIRNAATRSGARIVLVDESEPYPAGSLPEAMPAWFQ